LFSKITNQAKVHAEKIFAHKLTEPSVWPKLVKSGIFKQGEPNAIHIVITRSPCGNPGHECGQELINLMGGFIADKNKGGKKGFQITLKVETISAYNGKSGAQADASFESIKKLLQSDIDFGVVSWETLETYLDPDNITEEAKDVLKRKIKEAKKKIKEIQDS
jgi:hypothetical protein